MKKLKIFSILLGILITVLFSSCFRLGRGFKIKRVEKTPTMEEYYASGNYYQAFWSAITILKKNSSEEKRNGALSIIEDSYAKYLEKEESILEYDVKTYRDDVDFNYGRINIDVNSKTKKLYERCKYFQDDYNRVRISIKDIGPMYYGGRELVFPLKDYSGLVKKTKDKYSDLVYLVAKTYTEGRTYPSSQDAKKDYREAYKVYVQLQKFDNGYKKDEVIKLKDEAYKNGLNYVTINFANSIKKYAVTEKEVLAGLDLGDWITIGKDAKGKYDFNMVVTVENFDISKGDLQRTVFDKEKEIVIQENVPDRDRRPVVVSRRRLLKSRLEIIDLFKEAFIRGTIKIVDNYSKKTKTFTIEAPSIFKYSYAMQEGDIRAIDPEYLPLLDKKPTALPTDYEMNKIGLKLFSEELASKIIGETYQNY